MKKCPYCSGAVQDDAQVCPLCQMSLVAPPAPVGAPMGNPMGAPPPGMGYAAGPFPPGGQETSGKAIASLVCGVLGFVILPIILAIPAIVLGHLSLSEIKKSAGRIKGQGMAIAGLVLGYVGIAFIPIILIIAAIAIPNLIRSKMAANEASAIGTLRMYNTALVSYAATCPQQGFPDSAENLGPGNGDCTAAGLVDSVLAQDIATRSGYRFFYAHGAPDAQGHVVTFTLNADPVAPSTGSRHFFTDETGVIRVNSRSAADKFSPELN
jgi:type IV pilus assembly protein PilA